MVARLPDLVRDAAFRQRHLCARRGGVRVPDPHRWNRGFPRTSDRVRDRWQVFRCPRYVQHRGRTAVHAAYCRRRAPDVGRHPVAVARAHRGYSRHHRRVVVRRRTRPRDDRDRDLLDQTGPCRVVVVVESILRRLSRAADSIRRLRGGPRLGAHPRRLRLGPDVDAGTRGPCERARRAGARVELVERPGRPEGARKAPTVAVVGRGGHQGRFHGVGVDGALPLVRRDHRGVCAGGSHGELPRFGDPARMGPHLPSCHELRGHPRRRVLRVLR